MVGFLWSVLVVLISVHYSLTYENEGRLHSQHRVFPHAKTAPVHYYCDEGVKLCAADFKGYYVGCYQDNFPGIQYYYKCTPGTRCGCQLNGECDMDDPCIPLDIPYPMKRKATFRFNGTTKNWFYLKHGSPRTSRNIVGLVKQDADQGKYLQIIHHEGYTVKSFELIVPNMKGGYTKYLGYSDPALFPCKEMELQSFERFGADIKNHLLTSIKGENGKAIQTWDYIMEFDWMSWKTFKWRWVVRADPITQTATPVRTEYYADGIEGADKLAYEEKQNISWVTGELEDAWGKHEKWYTDLWTDGEASDDWFRVPEMCKHVKATWVEQDEREVKKNGGWSAWTRWTGCPSACGLQREQSRRRKCSNPVPRYGGTDCEGEANETRGCPVLSSCPAVNGGWSDWGFWNFCSVTCGGGVQRRRRRCDNPLPQYGGKECRGYDYETRKCRMEPCPPDGGAPYAVNSSVKCLPSCGRSGYCSSFCGEGGFCCRKGWAGCPYEAQDVAPWTHYTCIKYRKEMPPEVPETTSSQGPGCWDHLSPGCVRGHNVGKRYRNATLQQCKKFCFDISKCLAFEFGVAHGGARKVYKAGDCQLNNGNDSSRCDGLLNNLDLYIKRRC